MNQAATELAATLSSIESIKAYLAGLVSTAQDNRQQQPVLLTYVGGEFAKSVGVPFEKHVTSLVEDGALSVPKTRRKLVAFVQSYCLDVLSVTRNEDGIYSVARAVRGASQTEDARSATGFAAATPLRFHRAVWAAFIRPLEGRRRFLNLDQIGFTNAQEKPAVGEWREIDEEFILGASPGAPIDGAELQRQIERWSQTTEVPISKLVMAPKPVRELPSKLKLLLDLVDDLPPPIAASWMIPAALLRHLRNER